jgi:hypothetical protein
MVNSIHVAAWGRFGKQLTLLSGKQTHHDSGVPHVSILRHGIARTHRSTKPSSRRERKKLAQGETLGTAPLFPE